MILISWMIEKKILLQSFLPIMIATDYFAPCERSLRRKMGKEIRTGRVKYLIKDIRREIKWDLKMKKTSR